MARNEFTVMTINVGGPQSEQKQLNPQQIAEALAELIRKTKINPAIIAIQESHRVWSSETTSYSETSEELAKRLGALYRSFFFPYLDSSSHAHKRKWERPAFQNYGRAMQGNAIITRLSLANWPWQSPAQNYPTPNKPAPISTQISIASLYSTGNRDTEPRNLIVVPLKFEDISLYFMATHLTTLSGEDRHDLRNPRSQEASAVRQEQAKAILGIADELHNAERESKSKRRPIILAGDFNALPDSPEINELEKEFSRSTPRWYTSSKQSVWTHANHRIHIDHIFYDDPDGLLTLKDCFTLEPSQVGEITDHLPVVAKFRLSEIKDWNN